MTIVVSLCWVNQVLNALFLIANQINIKEFQEKIKMTAAEEKIHLTYKPLKEIKQNLLRLQSKWLQPLKPKSTKKQEE
mgnify:CR=1 FL=1